MNPYPVTEPVLGGGAVIFHLHNWSDWAISERGKVVDSIYTKEVVGSYIVQDRFCLSCGKTQIEQQRAGSIRSSVRLVANPTPAQRAPLGAKS